MKHPFKALAAQESGATIIETAFVLPIFAFMLFAIFELAIIFFYSFVLESAMYSVTRFTKVQTDPSTVVNEVRNRIGQLSLGLMDPKQVIITTNLNIDLADDWENAPPEICVDQTTGLATGETCATNECSGPNEAPSDVDGDGICDKGNPQLNLGGPGSIVSYLAFYKKTVITPGLGPFVNQGAGSFLNNGSNDWYLISSATVARNEPL